MTPVAQAFESHLQGEVTTHCFVWIIRRSDELVLGFTDHDRIIAFEGISCEPLTGLNSSEATTTLGLSIAGGEVEGVLSSSHIRDADIEQGLYDGAVVETYLINWNDPQQQFIMLRRWSVGAITRAGSRFIMELKGAAAAFDAICGRRVMRQCGAVLGDKNCRLDIHDPRFTMQGSVLQAEGSALTVTGLEGFVSGWFSEGVLTWVKGENAGRSMRIVTHAGDELQLTEPAVLPIALGDEFIIVAGCDKSFATCKAKFSNGINFQGFPHLPGNDAAFSYLTGADEYNGKALVP